MKYSIDFYTFLEKEKRCSAATLNAYTSDVDEFCAYLAGRGKTEDKAAKKDVSDYLESLKNEGRSMSTINRKLVSMRAYYDYLVAIGQKLANPVAGLKAPKVQHKDISYLSVEEVERLLAQPDDSPLGKRDRALLELMYACGLKAGEAAEANASDLDLRIGFISCRSESAKSRIIPIGRPARAALLDYLGSARAQLLGKKEDSGALFLNYAGVRITRQGIWKLIRFYGEQAGLKDLSPQILRNSFAAHMIQNGADLKSLQELLGHEDIAATRLFLTLTRNRVMDVYDRTHPRA